MTTFHFIIFLYVFNYILNTAVVDRFPGRFLAWVAHAQLVGSPPRRPRRPPPCRIPVASVPPVAGGGPAARGEGAAHPEARGRPRPAGAPRRPRGRRTGPSAPPPPPRGGRVRSLLYGRRLSFFPACVCARKHMGVCVWGCVCGGENAVCNVITAHPSPTPSDRGGRPAGARGHRGGGRHQPRLPEPLPHRPCHRHPPAVGPRLTPPHRSLDQRRAPRTSPLPGIRRPRPQPASCHSQVARL